MSARPFNSRRAWTFSAAISSALWLCLLTFSAACSRQIGDGCTLNVECSPQGDRFCDLSSPGGYCTVEGCDAQSCPDGAVCVRFFSLQRGAATCDTRRTARTGCTSPDCCEPGSPGCCRLGERCLCDTAGCAQGYCASETSEHRWCMHRCNSDGDCRDNYRCYATNQGGAIATPVRADAGTVEVPAENYCAPTIHE